MLAWRHFSGEKWSYGSCTVDQHQRLLERMFVRAGFYRKQASQIA
jgi:hypothetical protein